ncbi:MAG TPA: hypothetical protein VHW47_08705 [Acidimicrobiales bacterium]|jgi:hypothetical protein|nr:hypothetical protein [Acidimicrobiales bacterium]
MPPIEENRGLDGGDHALTLPGGRTLGYAVHDDPTGLPIVNCHGGLVSGHDVSPPRTWRELVGCA